MGWGGSQERGHGKLMEMAFIHLASLIFLITLHYSLACPDGCNCTSTDVTCFNRTHLGAPKEYLNKYTETIDLSFNNLTMIPDGSFSGLKALQLVNLENNPWICDCDIFYLYSWLIKQNTRTSYKSLRCTGPNNLKGRRIELLHEHEILSSCPIHDCTWLITSHSALYLQVVVHAVITVSMLFFLAMKQTALSKLRNKDNEYNLITNPKRLIAVIAVKGASTKYSPQGLNSFTTSEFRCVHVFSWYS
uniref:LRRCT domain-containing protein n=1 Tax=Eptatretus burgeri TaxID=7764 RepID=A0A8C4QET7_EPTBU